MKMLPQVKPASKGADEGWAVLSTLISGIVIFGGIGWLLDQWWGTRLATPVGLVIGMALGIYAVVAQFGRSGAAQSTEKAPSPGATQAANAAQALRAAKAVNWARRAQATSAAPAVSEQPPNDGPPPASTRRETECL
jgi:F0F1-type ATP synthase assembly protein I